MKKEARLKTIYKEEVIPALIKKFEYKNVNQVPKLEKIVLNMGVGDALFNIKFLSDSLKDLTQIAGQKPVITKAKKSVASFKIRQGMAIGCKVTLRRAMMYEFLDRLITAAIPRIRDFRGISPKSFDGRGNFSMGITEQVIFPEIDYDKVEKIRGMDITIVTSAKTDEEALHLLKELGMPFQK